MSDRKLEKRALAALQSLVSRETFYWRCSVLSSGVVVLEPTVSARWSSYTELVPGVMVSGGDTGEKPVEKLIIAIESEVACNREKAAKREEWSNELQRLLS